ncbi:MAG: DHH family phosphoesterase [Candidatus Bathyarchaeota archaeon]|nr:DHH family phosphoesterase [Candidatus Bathyarchaeota archaeon]
MQPSLKTMCVSHLKDVDGCVCAAIIRSAIKANFMLTNYGNITTCFSKIRQNYGHVYICDLGLNENHIKSINRVRQFAEVTYIDHHQLDPNLIDTLQGLGVDVIHDTRDCASVLTFQLFHKLLPHEAGILPCYSAISDRLEQGPQAQALLNQYDRDFVLFETMLLTYAIEKADIIFKKRVVNQLAKLNYPHQIKDVSVLALEQLSKITALRQDLPLKAKALHNLTYIEMPGESLGAIANLLLDVCNADVSISYNHDPNKAHSDLSIRGKSHMQIDLGTLTSVIAKQLGGFGGGHALASGARVPSDKVMDFIKSLDSHITQITKR